MICRYTILDTQYLKITYDILPFDERMLPRATMLSVLARHPYVPWEWFFEHEFSCIQLTTHYSHLFAIQDFKTIYNYFLQFIFFSFETMGNNTRTSACMPYVWYVMRSFRFGGGIGTIDFANLGGQLSSLGNLF